MRQLNLPARRALPSRWAVMVLLACIVASLFIALTAGAQGSPKAGAPAATASPAPAGKVKGTAPPAATPAKPDVSVPPKAEESATIQDDPTIVPDPKESADNNITFPVDI
ncbi:MAG: hypothetical protein WDO56_34235 [Gammaproteobacteria bacterium]